MAPIAANSLPAFGFLTATETAAHGWFGGYLVLSLQGRPLEFRCTTPVLPSRAQEILYGKTLQSYLLSEVVGHALVQQAELPVLAVLTDKPEMQGLSLLVETPICLVEPTDDNLAIQTPLEIASAGITIGQARLTRDAHNPWSETVREQLNRLAASIDLLEPFERIQAALAEAQQAALEVADDPQEGEHEQLPAA